MSICFFSSFCSYPPRSTLSSHGMWKLFGPASLACRVAGTPCLLHGWYSVCIFTLSMFSVITHPRFHILNQVLHDYINLGLLLRILVSQSPSSLLFSVRAEVPCRILWYTNRSPHSLIFHVRYFFLQRAYWTGRDPRSSSNGNISNMFFPSWNRSQLVLNPFSISLRHSRGRCQYNQ